MLLFSRVMANDTRSFRHEIFLLAILIIVTINGQPIINPEDVESLLPETPKTNNETIAAIVKDTVIQEAVQTFVGDGSLSGLVVKKDTVILPAAKPDVVLGYKEQILAAPLSELEDIRKNITETVATTSENENSQISEVEEIAVGEVVPIISEKMNENLNKTVNSTPDVLISETELENSPETLIAQDLVLDTSNDEKIKTEKPIGVEKLIIPGIIESEIKLPEGIIPENISLPPVITAEISKPIIAVVEPVKKTENSVDLSLNKKIFNVEKSDDEKLEYGTRISTFGIKSLPVEKVHPAVQIEIQEELNEKKKKILEEKEAVQLLLLKKPKDSTTAEYEFSLYYYENEKNDMIAAEDIIFRPLFHYRQQQNERKRILENRSYQKIRYNNNRYRPPPPSPYSSYEDNNYNYLRRNSNKKPQRTRYYNDYN